MKQKSLKIFIVEDNPVLSKLLQQSISANYENSEFFIYKSVESALGNVNEQPDYLILDHFLEKSNGIDSIPVFREFLPATKIIVLSSQDDIKAFENAFIYGANEYFRKDALITQNILGFIKQDLENIASGFFTKIIQSFKKNTLPKKQKVIYVLDDNINSAFSIEHLIQSQTFNTVYSFNKSKEFFEQLEITKPDVVVLDYNLEEKISGRDVLIQIKLKCPETEVIIFSTQTDVTTASVLLKLGASHYLTKSNENLLRLKTYIN